MRNFYVTLVALQGINMTLEEKIGEKIRNLRNENGLTQEELADRTELTKGFISQLERGLTAPSVSTLSDIVECLGTNLSDFFHDDDEQIVYRKEDYFEKIDEADNKISWLIPTAQSNQIEPILVEIAPGELMLRDKPHEGEEFGYVLKGCIKLHFGNKEYVVAEGDSFYFPAKRDHWIVSNSTSISKLLWISSPPNF